MTARKPTRPKQRATKPDEAPQMTATQAFAHSLVQLEEAGMLSGFAYVIYTTDGGVSTGHAGMNHKDLAATATYMQKHAVENQPKSSPDELNGAGAPGAARTVQ